MKTILIIGVYTYPDIPEAHRIIQTEIAGARSNLKYEDEDTSLDGVDRVLVFCNSWQRTPTNLIWRARERGIPLSLYVNEKERG